MLWSDYKIVVFFALILQGLKNVHFVILILNYSYYRLSALPIFNNYIIEEWLIKLSQNLLVYFMLRNFQGIGFGQNIFTVSQAHKTQSNIATYSVLGLNCF